MFELLYWGHGPRPGENYPIRMHKHDFCQIEMILKGERVCKSPEEQLLLRTGEAVFVPTNVAHSFADVGGPESLEYLSFKFRLGEDCSLPPRIFRIPRDPFSDWIFNDFKRLIADRTYQTYPACSELMAALLNALLEHLHHGTRLSPEPPLLSQMRTNIWKYGALLRVDSCAAELGMSMHQFRREFQRAMREVPLAAMRCRSPAVFIKQELVGIAAKRLRETDISIGNLAEMLHFNNIYTFSRFFRNAVGCSPSQYRKKYGLRS